MIYCEEGVDKIPCQLCGKAGVMPRVQSCLESCLGLRQRGLVRGEKTKKTTPFFQLKVPRYYVEKREKGPLPHPLFWKCPIIFCDSTGFLENPYALLKISDPFFVESPTYFSLKMLSWLGLGRSGVYSSYSRSYISKVLLKQTVFQNFLINVYST